MVAAREVGYSHTPGELGHDNPERASLEKT
jgi:hypothetical protein